MTRLTFFWRALDARDRLMVAGVLAVTLVVGLGAGHVTAAHRARVDRERFADCPDRWECAARARGYAVIRARGK